MAKFFVGQRVRVVSRDEGSKVRCLPNGAQGVIVERGSAVDWRVRFPGHRNARIGGDLFPMFSHELEPILDQKHEACDEEFKRDMDELLDRCRAGEGLCA